MASGMYIRLQKYGYNSKMYGFERVDKEKEMEIVERLTRGTNSSKFSFDDDKNYSPIARLRSRSVNKNYCEKLPNALAKEDIDIEIHGLRRQQILAEEKYAEHVFRRLVKTHTFSSKSKQRSVDPKDLDPDGVNVSAKDSNPSRPNSSQNPVRHLKTVAHTALLSQNILGGFLNIGRPTSSKENNDNDKSKSSMNAMTLKALGKFKFQNRKEDIEKEKREQKAENIYSSFEIVNARDFVRNYEKENARHTRLAKLARPTYSSKFKRFNNCPFCEENSDIAEVWLTDKSGICEKCHHDHEDTLAILYTGQSNTAKQNKNVPVVEAGEDDFEDEQQSPEELEAEKRRQEMLEQEELVHRLRVPTRSSEGGRPFCKRTADISDIGYTVVGIPRPMSAVDRIRSAKKKQEAIDLITERLYRPKSVRSFKEFQNQQLNL